MADKPRKKGFGRRAWSSKKGKAAIIIGVIVLIPMIGFAADSVYSPLATQSGQKGLLKANSWALNHPGQNAWHNMTYTIKKAVNPNYKPSNVGERRAATLNKSEDLLNDVYFKRNPETAAALKRLKSKDPNKYNQIMDGLKQRGMKDGKMPANATKYLNDQLAQSDPTYKKQMQKNTSDLNKDAKNVADAKEGGDGDDSFKSKIASALLHIFWSGNMGKWLEQNGAAGTVFTYNPYTDGGYGKIENADVAGQLESKINNHPSQLMFPAAAYSTKFTVAIDYISPAMYALSAIMLVAAVIVGATKMGWGQAFNSASSRIEWYHNLIDVITAVASIFCLPIFVRMLLQMDGAFLQLFANLLQSIPNGTKDHTLMTTCLQLGVDDNTIKAITKGSWLGGGFAGVIFVIIYLLTAIGIAIWIKFYYWARMITFIILMILGPIFIALWPFNFGKARTFNWLRDVIGTIFIQPIQAFTLTLMTFLLWINSSTFGSLVTDAEKQKDAKALGTLAGSTTSSGAIQNAVSQIATVSKDYTVANHFEMMVMAFIVLILFIPVSNGIASLFGIGTSMLDRIHSSTSRTLLTGAAIGGTAALGIAAGAAHGASGAAHGLAAMSNEQRLKAGQKLLDADKAKGNLGSQSLLKRRQALQKLGNKVDAQKNKAREAIARANGLVGPNAGRLMGAALGAGTGNVANMAAMSVAGGEIGARAAQLNQTAVGLTGLGLKRANMNRAHNKHIKQLNDATDSTMRGKAKSNIDANPGPNGSITDQVTNNSKLTDKDKQQALENVKAYQQSGINGNGVTPSDEATRQRIQMEKLKDTSGNYVPNSEVQANSKEIIDGLTDGVVYDQVHGAPETEQAAIAKAQKVGFDYNQWKKNNAAKYQNLPVEARQQAMLKDANSAMNHMRDNLTAASQMAAGAAGAATADVRTPISTNEIAKAKSDAKAAYDLKVGQTMSPEQFTHFKQTPEYRAGLQNAQAAAIDKAYVNSNGGVVAHTDMSNDSAFNNSLIDGNRYKDNLDSQLKALNVAPSLRRQLVNASDGLDGKSMIQTIDAGNGDTANVINSDVFNQMQRQRAYSLRKRGIKANGHPITSEDLSQIAAPGLLDNDSQRFASPEEYQAQFQKENTGNYARVNAEQAQWNRLKDITMQAAQSGLGGRLVNRASGLFGFGNGGGSRTSRLESRSAQPVGSGGLISRLTSENPYADVGGMSLDDVRDMVPQQYNDQGEPIGVTPGSLRSVITNNYSLLQARDSDSNYHTVGNLGPGDGTLGANSRAYQDYDLTPTGDLITRMDPTTHRPTTPYRMEGDSHIPVSLPNGVPDVSTYFDKTGDRNEFAGSQQPYAVSDYMGLPNAPQTRHALATGGRVYGDDFADFTNKTIRGNYDGVVMTGVDPRDGQTKVLSEQFDNTIWPGMDSGYEFALPVKESNGEFVQDTDRTPELHALQAGGDPSRVKNLTDEMLNIFESRKSNIQNYINEAIMQPTKPDLHNFINNHPSHQSINILDTFTKDPAEEE